jgi:hypothetical protein
MTLIGNLNCLLKETALREGPTRVLNVKGKPAFYLGIKERMQQIMSHGILHDIT